MPKWRPARFWQARQPLKHRGEESQAYMALIRSREALVGWRTQLVKSRSRSGQILRRPSAQVPGQELPQEGSRAHPRGTPAGLRSHPGADRLAHRAHPRIRPKASDDLQGELSRDRSLAPGRGDRSAYGANLRADRGGSLPLRKEPSSRSIPGSSACQRSVRR